MERTIQMANYRLISLALTTVQDVMLGAVERRFGNDLPSSPVEWLTDNGSCYRANETRQ
ncbi:hypothetical protein HEQ57_26640, partial [Shigella sonnei]|nr:hypothetical protein [Shigella sonnei]